MKILIFGVSGMLGSTMFYWLSQIKGLSVIGTARSDEVRKYFPAGLRGNIVTGINVLCEDALNRTVCQQKPDVMINCVGLIKQLSTANDPLVVLPINSMLPHRLAAAGERTNTRLIHISTDCVFDGRDGNYLEFDTSNATDLYGKSKYIGELHDKRHAITVRTSIIGHELSSTNGLIEWFLAQSGSVKGFTRAIFSGLPTIELARVISEFIIPDNDLFGLYHVSAEPISKFDLLSLVAKIYGKEIEISPDSDVVIDRSLNSELFQSRSGYRPPKWPQMIMAMKDSKIPTDARNA